MTYKTLKTQQVSTISCIERTAGYRGKVLRINTLRERTLRAFRSSGLREDERERALDERDQNTGGKARRTGLEGLWGSHARFPAQNSVPQSAPVMSTDYTKTPNRAFPLGASLNTGQKIFCAWQCHPRNRGFSWTATHFHTSRPRFRPFSWMEPVGQACSMRPSTKKDSIIADA